ncbi:hypothetical protein Tco_1060333 [Tanacetum coccineum]
MGDRIISVLLGDYSKPSHGGYRNTIELPVGNNMVPLRSDTIRLVQNGCSFHGLRSEDPNQYLKDFLKLVDSLDLDGDNRKKRACVYFNFPFAIKIAIGLNAFQQDPSPHESLSEAWNRFKDLLQKVPSWHRNLWLQVQIFYNHVNPVTRRTIDQSAGGKLRDLNAEESWALLEDLALYDNERLERPTGISLSRHRQCCASRCPSHSTAINGARKSSPTLDGSSSCSSTTLSSEQNHFLMRDLQCSINTITIYPKQQSDSHNKTKENGDEEKYSPENHPNSPIPPDPSISFIPEKVLKFNSLFESLGLVPSSPNAELICTKEEDGDVMFIEIISRYDNSHKEESEAGVQE